MVRKLTLALALGTALSSSLSGAFAQEAPQPEQPKPEQAAQG